MSLERELGGDCPSRLSRRSGLIVRISLDRLVGLVQLDRPEGGADH